MLPSTAPDIPEDFKWTDAGMPNEGPFLESYYPATFGCIPFPTRMKQMNGSSPGPCRAEWHVDEGIHLFDSD
ncbi:hypothetical protein AMECASPLE_013660 [Ameca splendens]|uniref:Uncharacterized protein n=1 Tax=Ameca splendens TaxID=208324 RepID=A0ABV0YZD0_9TELE